MSGDHTRSLEGSRALAAPSGSLASGATTFGGGELGWPEGGSIRTTFSAGSSDADAACCADEAAWPERFGVAHPSIQSVITPTRTHPSGPVAKWNRRKTCAASLNDPGTLAQPGLFTTRGEYARCVTASAEAVLESSSLGHCLPCVKQWHTFTNNSAQSLASVLGASIAGTASRPAG